MDTAEPKLFSYDPFSSVIGSDPIHSAFNLLGDITPSILFAFGFDLDRAGVKYLAGK